MKFFKLKVENDSMINIFGLLIITFFSEFNQTVHVGEKIGEQCGHGSLAIVTWGVYILEYVYILHKRCIIYDDSIN